MNFNWMILLPEIAAIGVLIILLCRETFGRRGALIIKEYSTHHLLVWAACFIILLATISLVGVKVTAFKGMIQLDPLAIFFKIFFVFIVMILIMMNREYFSQAQNRMREFLLVSWTTLLGLFFLVSSSNLLLIFLALEIVTLSFYILTAYQKDLPSIEASIKYLIVGSIASAIILYSISLFYVSTGSTDLMLIRDAYAKNPNHILMLTAILFMIAGLGFKMATFPFQFWVADVYEGAPTPTAAFLSVGSKAAGFAVMIRLLDSVFMPFEDERKMIFSILAAATLLYGNLGALVQNNVKRLLGYSSIGHAGYLLIGIATGHLQGTIAVLFYLVAYGVSTLTAFLVVTLVERDTGSNHLEAYRGLSGRSPFLAGCLFVSLMSLAGVPPLAGFFGKFLILLQAASKNLFWLAILGSLVVPVSLYYYLRIIRVMYLEETIKETPVEMQSMTRLVMMFLVLGIILLGLIQAPVYEAAELAAYSLL